MGRSSYATEQRNPPSDHRFLRLHGARASCLQTRDRYPGIPTDNTTAALLNKINAAGMVNARMAADTNKALVSQAEMQLIELKQAP